MRERFVTLSLVYLLIAGSASPATPKPTVSDDAAQLVVSVESDGSSYAWQLPYGQAREMTLQFLADGKPDKALQAAKMQFIIGPPPYDPAYTEAAIRSVKEALIAADGNDKRAKLFETYALNGPAGLDGRTGTKDDLSDPLKDVPLTIFKRDSLFYAEYDKKINEREAVADEKDLPWYETEKAYARLNGADFDMAATLLMKTLQSEVWMPRGRSADWEVQRVQDVMDRITAGLGIVYRAKKGTVAGMDAFITNCLNYAKYGPAGDDLRDGTADDLADPF